MPYATKLSLLVLFATSASAGDSPPSPPPPSPPGAFYQECGGTNDKCNGDTITVPADQTSAADKGKLVCIGKDGCNSVKLYCAKPKECEVECRDGQPACNSLKVCKGTTVTCSVGTCNSVDDRLSCGINDDDNDAGGDGDEYDASSDSDSDDDDDSGFIGGGDDDNDCHRYSSAVRRLEFFYRAGRCTAADQLDQLFRDTVIDRRRLDQNFQSNFKRFHGLPCPGGVTESVTRDCADMCERYSGLGAFGKGLGAVNVKLSSDTWPGEDFCMSRANLMDKMRPANRRQLGEDAVEHQECTCDCLKSCECIYPEVTPAIGEGDDLVAIKAVRDYSSVADAIGEGEDHRMTYSIGLPASTPLPSSCDVCGDVEDCVGFSAGTNGPLDKQEFCCNDNYCDDYVGPDRYFPSCTDFVSFIGAEYYDSAGQFGWAACCAGYGRTLIL